MFSGSSSRPMPGQHCWRHRAGTYDLTAAAHSVAVPPTAGHYSLTRVERADPLHITQPRFSVSNQRLNGSLEDLAGRPETGVRTVGLMHSNAAYLIDETNEGSAAIQGDPIPHTPRRPPDSLTRAVGAAWASTGELQRFYGAEFDHALARTGRRVDTLEASTLGEALELNFKTLQHAARVGTTVRTVRDMRSLAVTVPILAGVAVQIASDIQDDGGLEFASFCRANLPFGNIAASYGLMCAELVKAPLTTGLSYQTISRHHRVDEYLVRSELSLKLIDAC